MTYYTKFKDNFLCSNFNETFFICKFDVESGSKKLNQTTAIN